MKYQSALLLAVSLFMCKTEALGLSPNNGTGRALTFIGTYDNRQFYQAETTFATYADSVTRCSSQGLSLAKIHSAAELAYLLSLLPNTNGYWVAAKAVPAFEWSDGTSVNLPITVNDPTCLYISKVLSNLNDYGCTYGFYTLCQSA